MRIIETPGAMFSWSREQRVNNRTVCLVPTMGYFHEGHLRLMGAARSHGDKVVVSLFVNPTQFGPNEDLGRYPRDFDRDCRLAEEEGVDVLFAPENDTVYPEGYQTQVKVPELSQYLCGKDRPVHFGGVTTVVTKLFNMVQPSAAVFGEKDYQQLAIIRRLVLDLDIPVNIIGHPIVREPDGLAMSSRNALLPEGRRNSALSLYRSIGMAKELVLEGEKDTNKLATLLREHIHSYPGTAVDYVSFVDGSSLQDHKSVVANTLLALAVKIDNRVRLIDNSFVAA